jgi:hypothetical protein
MYIAREEGVLFLSPLKWEGKGRERVMDAMSFGTTITNGGGRGTLAC